MYRYYAIRQLKTAVYSAKDTTQYVADLIGESLLGILDMMGYDSWVDIRMKNHSDEVLTRKLNDICKKFDLRVRISSPITTVKECSHVDKGW